MMGGSASGDQGQDYTASAVLLVLSHSRPVYQIQLIKMAKVWLPTEPPEAIFRQYERNRYSHFFFLKMSSWKKMTTRSSKIKIWKAHL